MSYKIIHQFRSANLTGANLTDAALAGANLTDAALAGADLRSRPFGARMSYKIIHQFRSGTSLRQPMYDLGEARQELAAIVRNFRNWGFDVMKNGPLCFVIQAPDGRWDKSVWIEVKS